MPNREQICQQQIHCLSCPLSVARTGKECEKLTKAEIERAVKDAKTESVNRL